MDMHTFVELDIGLVLAACVAIEIRLSGRLSTRQPQVLEAWQSRTAPTSTSL